MVESDLNRIIYSSFRLDGDFAHKISDDAGNFKGTSKKPFDGFAVDENKTYFMEGKLIKSVYGSFNFNILEDHQIENLSTIWEKTRNRPDVFSLVYVGWWKRRTLFDVLFIDIDLILHLISQGKSSILKKELLLLKNEDLFLPIKKEYIDVSRITEKCVTKKVWEKVIG